MLGKVMWMTLKTTGINSSEHSGRLEIDEHVGNILRCTAFDEDQQE
jgi:hypothetical protein